MKQTSCFIRYWPIPLGFLGLYLPTLHDLATKIWMEGERLDAIPLLVIAAYLLWQKRHALPCSATVAAPAACLTAMVFGLLAYVLGRSQEILFFEVGSSLPVLASCILALGGWARLRAAWFPLLLLLFFLPYPGVLIDSLTGELKQHVSAVSESLLYALGYPVGRTGVVLSVGPYQLLVADACSGLNSIVSLCAIGLIYLYITPGGRLPRTAILVASILPIAFAANIVRVLTLVLLTYHFGDDVGQGFAHSLTHILLFATAVALLIGIDRLLGLIATGASQRCAT